MEKFDWYSIFQRWMIFVFGIDIIWFGYFFVARAASAEIIIADFFGFVTYFILIISLILIVVNIIVSLKDKYYKGLLYGLGIFIGSFIVFLALIISALASVF